MQLDLSGFQTLVRENIQVSVGQTTPVDLTLRVATLAETVTVTGQSPVIDTTSANVNVTLSQELLQATPGGRDIWSLVEYKVPGLVTSRPDVGGAAGGLQGSFSARGTANSQNVQFFNGINVGDPAAIGFTQFYYDYEAFEEIQVSTGAHDLSVPSAGVFLNMVSKTGGDRFGGKASYFWQGDQTQTENIDDELRRFGFRDDAGAVDFISDVNLQGGGPLVANKLRFFGSFRDWRVHVNVPGFPEIEETNITSGLGTVTWQLTDRHRLSGFVARQYYKKPNRGASALVTPESNFNEDDVTSLYQGLWNSVLSNRAFLDARLSYNDLFFPLFQKGSDQTLFDTATGVRTRAALNEFVFERRRLQANVNLQYFVDRALGGRHEIRVGFDHAHAPTKTAVNRIDDLALRWNSATGQAVDVELFNSPVRSKATVDTTALFVQDSYSVGRVTVAGGLRWERLEGYLPSQDSPPSRFFPDVTRRFDEVRDIPNWNDLAVRVSTAWDLFGTGKTALKGAYGRYYYTLSTGTPNSVNPNFNVSERFVWNDLNGDQRFQDGEQGALLARTGGLVTSMDPGFVRPFTDEVLLALDHEVLADLRVSLVGTYRRERDQFGSIEVGIPLSAYTLVSRTDLGRDGLAGTADDTVVFVFDQARATLGQNRKLITNSDALNQVYRGFEATATKRFSRGWQILAGYTYSKAIVNAEGDVGIPNTLINARGVTALDRTHSFKLTGSFLLPYDVQFSGNLRSQSGTPLQRTHTFNLTQGNVTVNSEPRGAAKTDVLTTVDLRLGRTFRTGGRSLEVMLDVYNLSNANTVWQARTLTGRINVREGGAPVGALVNQPQFLSPTGILGPRIVRFGLAYRF